MTCGLVHASYSLPEWQTVKLTFFAPWLFICYSNRWFFNTNFEVQHQPIRFSRPQYLYGPDLIGSQLKIFYKSITDK